MGKKIILLILCISLSITIGCEKKGTDVNRTNGEVDTHTSNEPKKLTINYSSMPLLDQSIATDEISFEVLGNTLEGLFVLTGGNKLQNGVCESYIISNGGRTYTFKLRKNSVWSNGEPVTAHDFVYSWRRLADSKTYSLYSFMLETAEIKNSRVIIKGDKPVEELGVYAEDDYTLVVELEQPVPYLINILSFPSFLPLNEKFIKEKGEDFGTSPPSTLFNGPYVVSGWNSIVRAFNYIKNDNYWNKDSINIDKIVVKVQSYDEKALQKYEDGYLDYLNVSSSMGYDFSSHEDLTTVFDSYMLSLAIYHNDDVLNNINARKAIALSIEKSYITDEILDNGTIPANYLVPKGFAINPEGEDFRETTDTYNQYNPEEGVRYWEKAKEELGIEATTLVFLTLNSETTHKMTDYIKEQLESNLEGLKVDIAVLQLSGRYRYPTFILDGELMNDISVIDLGFIGWIPDYADPLACLEMWTTDHQHNELGYSNKDYDKIIGNAKTGYLATHEMKRWVQLQKAERILLEEDVALIPLYQKGFRALIQEYVKNWQINFFPPERYWGTMDIVTEGQ